MLGQSFCRRLFTSLIRRHCLTVDPRNIKRLNEWSIRKRTYAGDGNGPSSNQSNDAKSNPSPTQIKRKRANLPLDENAPTEPFDPSEVLSNY